MPTGHSLLFVLFLLLPQIIPVGASSYSTPERVALENIKLSIVLFELERKRLPESWKEVDEERQHPLDEVFRNVLPTRRYALFSPPVVLEVHEKESVQLLAMTRKPMWETAWKGDIWRKETLKGPGRYLLYREPDGQVLCQWFDECTLQRFWRTTGHALPIPDNEPERVWVKKVRTRILTKRIVFGTLTLLAVAWISKRFFAKAKSGAIPT